MKSNTKEFSLAIVSENMKQIEMLNESLKDFGILPHYYTKLDEFWIEAKHSQIDFALVDIEKMSEGELLFKNHPAIKNKEIGFGFFSSNENKELLSSTYGLMHDGLIDLDGDIRMQLQVLLNRFNERLALFAANSNLATKLNHLDVKVKTWHQDFLKLKQMKSNEQLMNTYLKGLDSVATQAIFFDKLVINSDSFDGINKFGIYYLGKNNQSLVSPKIHTSKAVVLPELWVMNNSEANIDQFAIDMVKESSRGLFSKDMKIIKISKRSNVEALLLIDSSNLSDDFDYALLERRLTSSYGLIPDEERDYVEANNIFELAQLFTSNSVDKSERFIKLNLQAVINNLSKGSNQFSWNSFYNNLNSELSLALKDFTLYNIGINEIIVRFNSVQMDRDYQMIKAIVDDLEVWKYFENSSTILKSSPIITMSILNPDLDNLVSRSKPMANNVINKIAPSSNPYLNGLNL